MRGAKRRSRVWWLAAAPVGLGLAFLGACLSDIVPDPSTLNRCVSLSAGCGADGKDSCCAADDVAGGKFNRINDKAYPTDVPPFKLDRYEVTVGRFRAFVAGYALDKPRSGDGKNPAIGEASGWDPAWDDRLPKDQKELLSKLQCDQNFARWTADPGANEDQPINCVSWYVAFAFCAWDGGFLPTEAQWNYAAAGGDEQRLYPWGADTPDDKHAIFGCNSNVTKCPIPRVGSVPLGKGKWGQMDLAGSMAEWTLDYFGVLPVGCGEACANLADGGLGRDLRGGDFTRDAGEIRTVDRLGFFPEQIESTIGFRCARAE